MNEIINKKEIISNLQKLPHQIYGLMRELNQLKEQLDILKKAQKKIELEKTGQIVDEIDNKTGKPVFSNQNKRDVELNRQLQLDNNYQDNLGKIEEIKKKVSNLILEIDYSKNKFKSWDTIGRLMC